MLFQRLACHHCPPVALPPGMGAGLSACADFLGNSSGNSTASLVYLQGRHASAQPIKWMEGEDRKVAGRVLVVSDSGIRSLEMVL